MLVEWDIQKGSESCASCRAPFLDRQPYQCLLKLDAETPLREDYCMQCWSLKVAGGPPQTKDDAVWAARYRVAVEVPKEEALPRDHAEIVFRKLLATQQPGSKNILFVLAVMLERKRILKQQKVLREGKKLLVYTHALTQESIVIEDPQIRLTEWGTVQQEVKRALEDELLLLQGGPGLAAAQ